MFVLCVQKLANPVDAAPTTVVCLGQVVSADELKDDEKYEDIMDDMRQEACRYGISIIYSLFWFFNLVSVVHPTSACILFIHYYMYFQGIIAPNFVMLMH
jgi:hypothetical protein